MRLIGDERLPPPETLLSDGEPGTGVTFLLPPLLPLPAISLPPALCALTTSNPANLPVQKRQVYVSGSIFLLIPVHLRWSQLLHESLETN